MSPRPRSMRLLLATSLLAPAVALAACKKQAPPAGSGDQAAAQASPAPPTSRPQVQPAWQPPPPPPPVDPDAQKTLASMVEYVTELMEADAPDLVAFFALIHPESEQQEVWVELQKLAILTDYRMWRTMGERFGPEDIPPGFRMGRLLREEVAMEGEDRASVTMAATTDWYTPMRFVRADGHWYISGRTFQLAEQQWGLFRFSNESVTDLRTRLALTRGTAERLDALTDRLAAGEFETLDSFNRARLDLMKEEMRRQ